MLIQNFINGLLLGGTYAIIGVGFSLVFGVMGIINLAHGSFIMLGAYIAVTLFDWFQLDPFVSIIPSMGIMFLLGYAIQYFLINRVLKYGMAMVVVLTFGLDLVLINIAMLIWGLKYRLVSPSYAGASFSVGSINIPYARLGILAASIILTFLVYLLLNRLKYGKAIRATALRKDAAQLVGVEISRVYCLTFAISAALAGAAGACFSLIFTVIPAMGTVFLGKAFAVAILGGLGNVNGAIYGGLILGVAEAVGGAALGADYQTMISFALLMLMLILRPQGLVGRRFF